METPDWEGFYKHLRDPGIIPGYQVLNLLGHGTFGVVYRARKLSIGKPCAIKFLKVDDPGTSEAVLKELDSLEYLAQLDHPNLVSIEDKGMILGIPYIVMGYAGDETLATRLAEQGKLSPRQASRLMAQVARGVQALHEHGMVHFDIKPSNIFLKGDRPRLGDYGLARLITGSRRTLTFGRGTPLYMAPEMLYRKGDERSDIYSLGVVLFECVAGETPFKGDTEWEVMKKHEKEPLVFPRGFPEYLEAITKKAMAKKPEERYQKAAEMAELLEYVVFEKDLSWRKEKGSEEASPGRRRKAKECFLEEDEDKKAPNPLEFVLMLPGRILWVMLKYSFKVFGFAIELFLLVVVINILIRVLGGIFGMLLRFWG